MFRLMSIATLVMILVCFFVGAGIALADESPETGHINDATVHVDDTHVDNLAEADVYDFSDYINERAAQPMPQSNPVDAQEIEEPVARFYVMDC